MTYKILSLDGGGVWALIQVRTLIAMYGDIKGHAVLAKFDMAVANSGGSLVLGGLIEDKLLSEIAGFFTDERVRRSIFQPTLFGRILGFLHILPRFSTDKKLPALQSLMPETGGKTLADAGQGIPGASGEPIHLLICSFDYDRNVARFFRSKDAGGPEWGFGAKTNDATVAEAIHATTTPPVLFFDSPATWGDKRNHYWDGGIAGCNNPVLAGVAEAITLDKAAADIRALAIGTGTVKWPGPPSPNPAPLMAKQPSSSLFGDLEKVATGVLDDPPDVASFLAHTMTDGPHGLPPNAVSRIVRMNPMVGPVPDGAGGWKPPANWTQDQLEHLAQLDLAALEKADVDYIDSYGGYWLAGGPDAPRNQPIRMDADRLTSKLGKMTFQEAWDQWKLIAP